MFFEKIFAEFHKQHIRYLVIGGGAVNLHGFARATADLDILLSHDLDFEAAYQRRTPMRAGDTEDRSWLCPT